MRRLILGIIIFSGCIKSEDRTPITIKVLETVTNLPVSDASVTITDSNTAGLGSVVFTGYTDANGICNVPPRSFESGNSMLVFKGDYWLFQRQYSQTVYMTPMGWIQLRVHQVGNYPAGSFLSLTLIGESGRREAIDIRQTFALAFGGQKNKIEWQVLDAVGPIASGTLDGLLVPRLDTLKNVDLSY
jgi:hypothetical protein